ncbi:alpha/beta fold hydrolase [Pararhodobacter sp. CCB-MM2]|uniref:alpha/beta fold hydrolase n=1 Tax=Pararhodobacter sp. CCB-MM2 TaxID=1786003 RepID=UPI000AE8956A|nr:alpha/beta hydrolase [Pararhodobacter sp. CCB-MM2]
MNRLTKDGLQALTARLLAMSGDAELARLSPGLEVSLAVDCDGARVVIGLASGAVTRVDADSGDLTLNVTPEVLARALQTPPPPRHQGFTALQIANPEVSFSGDPMLLAQARAALERLFEGALAAPTLPATPRPRDLTAVSGRYVRLDTPEGPLELYADRAGSGETPLVFLHTAGADARQFQAQMSDLGLGQRFAMHAPDMPFHGRSLPPLDWDGAAYVLDADRYAGWVIAYLEQQVGRPALLAGCSMGAAITLEIAARRPDLLQGALAIEPPFKATGRVNRGQNDVAVHAGLHNGAFVRGLMAPTSPESYRRRASWIYAQGGPGVYQADLRFYSLEFDGAVTAPRIDAQALPVVLLCGAYDYSASPEEGARLEALMPGAVRIVMPQLGHFPMTEHPDLFAAPLDEALEILARHPRAR